MRDLREQIRDYIDDVTEPVTIEDVFFASADRKTPPATRPLWARRPWLIAAGAAAITVLLFGLVPLLSDESPSTVPPVTAPPSTAPTTAPATTAAEPTTAPSVAPTTTLVPPGHDNPLDETLESVVADLFVVAGDLGLVPPIGIDTSLEDDGAVHAQLRLSENGLSEAPNATLRVFPTVEAATAATTLLVTELLTGEPITAIELGDESYATLQPVSRSPAFLRYLVRDGTWVVEVVANAPAEITGANDAHLEFEPLVATFLGARGRGAGLEVSQRLIPFVTPSASETYEHGWSIGADAPDPPGPDFEEDDTLIEQLYSLTITPEGVRCRFYDHPFGAVEPQDWTEYFDDGSGTVTLSRRYVENDEFREEDITLADDDQRYLDVLSGCRRFDPVSRVLDVIFSVAPEPLPGERQQAASGDAHPITDGAWMVVEYEEERSFDLDPALLVPLGIMAVPDPDGVEFTRSDGSITSEVVHFEVQATGTRAALEAAFGIDLSDMPGDVFGFRFSFGFSLEPNGPGGW